MLEDETVMLDNDAPKNLGLDFTKIYRVTKIVGGQYLALDKGISGLLYHKKFFVSVGMAKCKYICITVPHNAPWMRVGEIYEGVENGVNTVHVTTPDRSVYVASTAFSKVRNWDEAKHVYDMMHQANIENALKFVNWNEDDVHQINAGSSESENRTRGSVAEG